MNSKSNQTLDAQSIKAIEQFSRTVCYTLANDENQAFIETEVIYGLAAFLAAALFALQTQTHSK